MHCVHDLTCSGGGSRADGDVLVAHDRRQKAGKAVLAVLQNQDHLQSYESIILKRRIRRLREFHVKSLSAGSEITEPSMSYVSCKL